MATAKDETKELWVDWTHDAMTAYERPEEIEEADVTDDMVDIATEYADKMLEEYEQRFSGGKPRRRGRKKDEDDE